MAKIECWFKQDLKSPVKAQTLNGNVFTLDNVGSLIGVEVYDNGVPASLSGSVNGYIILPDETTVSVAGTRSDNKLSINLPQSALAIPGFIKIAVKLTNSSEITTMLAVVATVVKSRTDTIITPSQQIITDWSQQIAAEMQAVEDASAAQDEKISDLKTALNLYGYADIADVTLTNGYYYADGTINDTSTTWKRTNKIDIENKKLAYKGFSGIGTNPKCVYFDKNNNALQSYSFSPQTKSTWTLLSPPENAKYIGFSIAVADVGSVCFAIDSATVRIDTNERNIRKTGESPYFSNGGFSITRGQYYNSSGSIVSSAQWGTTEKIPITADCFWVKKIANSGSPYSVYFDENESFLSAVQINANAWTLITPPDNAKYIALSVHKDNYNSFNICMDSLKTRLEEDENNIDVLMSSPLLKLVGRNITKHQYCRSDGEIVQNNDWNTTEAIDIPSNGKIKYTGFSTTGTAPKIVAFDSSDNVVKYFDPVNTLSRWVEPDLPGSAVKIIFSIHNTDLDSVQIYIDYISDKIDNHYNKNNVMPGKENECWSWWLYPQVVSYKGVRNKVYWGYTTADGFTGVGEYDIDSTATRKNNIIFSNGYQEHGMDDHNGCAVDVMDNGHIIAMFTGHNDSAKVIIRKSVVQESIESFDAPIVLDSSGATSYGQILQYDGKIYIFYRIVGVGWAMRYSDDNGDTWTDETVIVSTSLQYYCRFMPTTSDGVIRIIMCSNPDGGDVNIRQGFIHLSDGKIYNSNNTTVLGTSNIPHTSFSILIANETGKKQRLFDVAITATNSPLILYAPFASGDDSEYKIFDSGSSVKICDGGNALLQNSYLLGASWLGTDRIILSRGGSGADHIEEYGYSGGQAELIETIHSEQRGLNYIRNARPIIDVNRKAFMWQRGFYDREVYTNWNMDAMIMIADDSN